MERFDRMINCMIIAFKSLTLQTSKQFDGTTKLNDCHPEANGAYYDCLYQDPYSE